MRSPNRIFKFVRLLVVFLAMQVVLRAHAGRQMLTDHRSRVRVVASRAEVQALARLVNYCVQEVESSVALPSPDRAPWLTVELLAADRERTPSGDRLELDAEASLTESVHRICLALLAQRFGLNLPASAVESNGYDWLAAALAYPVRYLVYEGTARSTPRYEVLHAAVRGATLPDTGTLLSHRVSPSSELLYRLYALHCRLVLEVLEAETRRTDEPLKRIVELIKAGHTSEQAFKLVSSPLSEATESPDEWFGRVARNVVCGPNLPASASWVEERMARLETVMVVLPNREGGSQRHQIALENAARVLDTREARRSLAAQLENDFNALIRVAPPLLRKALVEYATTFDLLRQGRKRRFRNAVLNARKQFLAAVGHQKKVTELLRQTEAATTNWEEQNRLRLHAVRAWEERRGDLAPELYQFLRNAENGMLWE